MLRTLLIGCVLLHVTTGDLCSPNWVPTISAGCLLVNQKAENFDNSNYYCSQLTQSGTLIKIANPATTSILTNLLVGYPGTRWFIGLFRLKNTWTWSDYSTADYTNWAPNQPISSYGVLCATVDQSGLWYAQSCAGLLPSVCQGPENGVLTTTNPPIVSTTAFDPIAPLLSNAQLLAQELLGGKSAGMGYSWLTDLTDGFGPRIVGSKSLQKAIRYVSYNMAQQGFQNVRIVNTTGMPNWVRGTDTVTLLQPRMKKMRVLTIGRSVPGNLTAFAVVVRNFAELNATGSKGVSGKIVVFNQEWTTYSAGVAYRYGADQAEALGAVAVLVRSVTPFSVYSPHTGAGSRTAHIPQVSITVEDAELLWRLQQKGETIQISMNITSKTIGYTQSSDVGFELTGSTSPNEVVLLSGHLDSWDVGEGAMDDAGGCAVMWQVLTALKSLNLRSKRTIRVIFWGEEENGYAGPAYYNATLGDKHVFVSESDTGVWKPASRNASLFLANSNSTVAGLLPGTIISRVREVLERMGVSFGINPVAWSGGDVEPWEDSASRTPGMLYINMDTYDRYFTFHHTDADLPNVYTAGDLDATAAMFGAIAYVMANV